MKLRTRKYVMMLVAAVAGFAYARISVIGATSRSTRASPAWWHSSGLVGLPWMEFAPDGAFRRRPQA